MLKSSLAAAVAVSALCLASSAMAQSPYAPANKAVYTPMSTAHQQAQTNKLVGQCAKEVTKMQDQIGLRIQNTAIGAETRGSVLAALDAAAAAGDEDTCWHWYDRAQQVVR